MRLKHPKLELSRSRINVRLRNKKWQGTLLPLLRPQCLISHHHYKSGSPTLALHLCAILASIIMRQTLSACNAQTVESLAIGQTAAGARELQTETTMQPLLLLLLIAGLATTVVNLVTSLGIVPREINKGLKHQEDEPFK